MRSARHITASGRVNFEGTGYAPEGAVRRADGGEIDGGKGVFVGDFECGGEVNFLAVTLEAIGGDAAAEISPNFLLSFVVGFGAENVVNVVELFAREGSELGEGLEGRGFGGFVISS